MWIPFLAVVVMLFTPGCTGAQVTQTRENASAVLTYKPGSVAESRQQARLLAADKTTRPRIPAALRALNMAYGEYYAALSHLEEKKDNPEAAKALEKAALARYRDYRDLVEGQINAYEEFLLQYQDNWHVRHRYAWFLADHQMRHEAAAEWRRVVKTEPRYPYAYNNLATLYNHMGRDTEAMDLLRRAIEIYDEEPSFHFNLALNYSMHRYEAMERFGWDLPRTFQECMAEYRKARDLAPNSVEYARKVADQYILARFFNVTDTAHDAIAAWQYYLGLDLTPLKRASACRSIGRIYLIEKNDPVAAEEWLEMSLELFDDPGAHNLLERAKAARKATVPAEGEP